MIVLHPSAHRLSVARCSVLLLVLSQLLALALLVSWAPPAFAQPSTAAGGDAQSGAGDSPASRKEAAEALKNKADAFSRSRNYVDAVATYDESYTLYPDPRVLYNKARALQALGRYGEALQCLRRFEREAPPELKGQVGGFDELVREVAEHVTELTLHVNATGAQVILGDAVLGTTPLPQPLLVNAGTTRLRVVKDGYFPQQREVVLEGGGSAVLEVVLESKSRHAKLVVESSVAGARIQVDGRGLGQAPAEVVLLPGAHRVLAQQVGYDDASTQVVLEAGQNRTIRVDPRPGRRPVYRRWWFWTSVGAVVTASTVAIVVAAHKDPEPTNGDFSPSTISAPLARF